MLISSYPYRDLVKYFWFWKIVETMLAGISNLFTTYYNITILHVHSGLAASAKIAMKMEAFSQNTV